MADPKNRSTSKSSNSHRRPNEPRDSRGRFADGSIIDSARARPIAAAAAMTAVTAVAAAAGAYLWSKRSSSSPLMNWGQDDEADSFDSAGSASSSPSASAASDFAATGSAPGINPRSSSGETGLDQTIAEDTKVGSVAYGA